MIGDETLRAERPNIPTLEGYSLELGG